VTPLEAEQEFLNGFFTEFELDNPKTVMKCFPTETQKTVFDFATKYLDKACEMTAKELRELIEMVSEFIESMPESVGECLCENEEVKALAEEIGTVDMREVLKYIALHFNTLRKETCAVRSMWHNE